jgi:CBS domain-containing protein
LQGLVSRSDVLRWQVEGVDGATSLVENLSDPSQPAAFPESPGAVVADLIVQSGVGRIPIIERESRKVVGILTRQDLLKARRKMRTGETDRTRHVGWSVNPPR